MLSNFHNITWHTTRQTYWQSDMEMAQLRWEQWHDMGHHMIWYYITNHKTDLLAVGYGNGAIEVRTMTWHGTSNDMTSHNKPQDRLTDSRIWEWRNWGENNDMTWDITWFDITWQSTRQTYWRSDMGTERLRWEQWHDMQHHITWYDIRWHTTRQTYWQSDMGMAQ